MMHIRYDELIKQENISQELAMLVFNQLKKDYINGVDYEIVSGLELLKYMKQEELNDFLSLYSLSHKNKILNAVENEYYFFLYDLLNELDTKKLNQKKIIILKNQYLIKKIHKLISKKEKGYVY